MPLLPRVFRTVVLLAVFAVASHLALEHGTGGLWRGLRAAQAVVGRDAEIPYDLTQLRAVNPTLEHIRKKYVEPERVDPRQMFLGALDEIQKQVAQVIVTHEERSPTVKVRVFGEEEEFRVDNVQGHWDVAARLREVFAFLQRPLRKADVELPKVEYAAANGMLRTLDPHSVFLSPEAYKEMNVSTSGHFGGLGIVISIRDQMLTVMRPMPGTPAGRAGLQRLDRITKINNESTLNMPLEDSVKRLRGEPGSKVTIWVHRDGSGGWSGSRPFELTREIIRVDSVEHHALDGSVGYVRIKQFQATTADELGRALRDLKSKNSLSGLVLDLRDDPGGLLDQAGKVVDTFLSEGVIYATVGHSEGRHEQRATRSGTQSNYPIAVLVNGNSASASEIVAGALKNQNRAIVVGQTTFGKGSVQLVFPDLTPEGAALKLTIAQYLTPGDISIQGTGVTADVELDPMTVDTLEMDIFRNEGSVRERDLTQTLGAGGRKDQQPATHVLKFNLPESVRAEIRDRGTALDQFEVDGPIRLASSLLAEMKPGSRKAQLEQVRGLVQQLQDTEMQAVAADLAALGVDWSAPPTGYTGGPDPKDVRVTVSTQAEHDTVRAGEPMTLKVQVENTGDKPIFQLHAITKSDAGYYDQRELVFGKVAPGETQTADVPLGWCQLEGRKPGSTKPVPLDAKRVCKLPVDALTRQDIVNVRFFAEGADAPADVQFRPTVKEQVRPVFAYSYHVVDNRAANENGQLERGEGATIYFRVRNIGDGASMESQANLSNLSGDGLLLRAGRFDVSNMQPGEEREVAFTFDILPGLAESALDLRMSVADRDLGVVASEKLSLPIVEKKNILKLSPHKAVARARGKAVPLYAEPSNKGLVIGHLAAGSAVATRARHVAFTQVELGRGRFAFVRTDDLDESRDKAPEAADWSPELSHSPPRLTVETKQLATRGKSIRIQAKAVDGSGGVEDAFVFVGNRKVFYEPNGNSDKKEMTLSLDVPLNPGVNVITVVARQNEDTASRKTIVVRRDGPAGEALVTPKSELLGADWEFGDR